ncbi:conserved hypothetical protein [Verticillium alfalfae VaMs.102]|uniref:Uncharacterized protein n=1 Tax=Verticillium alfalfae (strain VaMs.102 / ATCC MYA-4576 / FGSC 10136) TaxID=526221 RepID=C9SFD3_VERA1|nr:conserved hypothetical protein [Verticillium alfalfae VaMs.102]EEY17919.1 conserved hypothetical protein [Verticillium alfalfae VaMs.102]
MESCEGVLLIPPERGQILGRAVWKPRYVVVGRRNAHKQDKLEQQPSPSLAQVMTTSRITNSSSSSSSKTPSKPLPTEDPCISVYKSKDDWEPTHQYPISAIVDCQVQMVAHRKQGPVLPTLVVTINDKERKRRSSRAGGLISSKEPSATTLWFRTPPDDHHISLHEWARFILMKKTAPMSPDSPASPSFINPFPQRAIRTNSESPSLRSKRSDISSPSSASHPAHMGYAMPDLNKYTTVLPTDIPSPVATVGEYQQGELIEGWTAAQGRSSTVSSPIRGRGSVSSQALHPAAINSSSPPAARETILDRAFQLRCIPGSEREVPGEEKLTSLARFDALMREADEKRQQIEKRKETERAALQSAWDVDDSSSAEEEDDEDSSSDEYAHEADGNRQTLIPPNAQRALNYLAGPPRQQRTSSQSLAHQQQQLASQSSTTRSTTNHETPLQAPSRPHTAHSKLSPSVAQRTHSQPQLVPQGRLDVPMPSSGKTSEDGGSRPNQEKRQSTSSAKRLSFTEFTKRLSSTSSLLLVQTNVSGGSSRESIEFDRNPSPAPRGTLNARGAPPRPRDMDREEWEKRCGWRAGVGFTEGGFL